MYSLNRAQIIGNVVADPEIRQTPSGQSVTTIRVATNRRYTDGSGTQQEQSEFHNVVCWGKLAEIVGQYLKKGQKVYFEGRLQTRSWEGQDGNKRYTTEVVAENMIMLSPKSGGGAPDFSDAPASEVAGKGQSGDDNQESAEPEEEKIDINDLPF